jgi:hypothetical protein
MIILPHNKQISPDKNVSFPCTTAAFTLPHEPAGFVVLCQLAQGLSLIYGYIRFLFIGSHICTPASFRPLLTETPLPSANTFVSIHYYEHHKFSYRGLSPHKLAPVPGVHKRINLTRISRVSFGHK